MNEKKGGEKPQMWIREIQSEKIESMNEQNIQRTKRPVELENTRDIRPDMIQDEKKSRFNG